MKKHFYKLAMSLTIGANILFFQNCDKKMEFSTPNSSLSETDIGEGDGTGGGGGSTGGGGTNPPTCTETFEDIQLPVKVLFIVDTSGSNADNTHTSVANDGTDVGKNWRRNILGQLRNVNNSSYFKYNYVLFRGNDGNASDCNRFGACPNGSTTQTLLSGFSNVSSEVDSALSIFQNTDDKGKTPYTGALTKAKQLIQADIAANPSDTTTRYSVIMVTDGHPDWNLVTKTGGNPNLGSDTDIPASVGVARGLVSEIAALDSDRVNVNTIYYFKPDQYSSTAVNILSEMANAGRGVFVKADTGNASIDLSQSVRVPKTTCPAP